MPAVIVLPMQVAGVTRDGVVQKFSPRWRPCFIIVDAGTNFPHWLQFNFIAGSTVVFRIIERDLGQWDSCNTMLYATDVEYH